MKFFLSVSFMLFSISSFAQKFANPCPYKTQKLALVCIAEAQPDDDGEAKRIMERAMVCKNPRSNIINLYIFKRDSNNPTGFSLSFTDPVDTRTTESRDADSVSYIVGLQFDKVIKVKWNNIPKSYVPGYVNGAFTISQVPLGISPEYKRSLFCRPVRENELLD